MVVSLIIYVPWAYYFDSQSFISLVNILIFLWLFLRGFLWLIKLLISTCQTNFFLFFLMYLMFWEWSNKTSFPLLPK